MNEKQKRFCDYYLELGNISKASLKAGYNKNTGHILMKNKEICDYIKKNLENLSGDRIAKASEVMKYLTKVMRGEEQEEVIFIDKCKYGNSDVKSLCKKVAIKDRLKAAELLGKRYLIFSKNQEVDRHLPIIINGENNIEK